VPPSDAELTGAELTGAELTGAELTGLPVDPVEADFADYLDAVDAGRSSVLPLSVVAGRVAEVLPVGPDLAAWLAGNPSGELEDGALAGAAVAYRRLAAWAQAGELAVVAQMASRSAAADGAYGEDGVGEDGRPGKIPADVHGQVSLALTMSQAGAQWWTGLAVDLRWRLAATGAALRDGCIDLSRARAIADATALLDDDKARAVEARVLPRAGEQTTGQLRASLRRAVITADPEGAERRREEAERRAKVTLYPDADGTACLAGQNLPGVHAAAAMARLTALARAVKASGGSGGIDLLRSQVFLGLLLGTLPHIPPPPGGPSDADCPPGAGPAGTGPAGSGPAGTGPAASGPADDDARSPLLEGWPWNNDPVVGQDTPASDPADKCSLHDPDHADEDPSPREDWPDDDGCQPGDDGPDDDGGQPGADWPGDDGCEPGDHCPADDLVGQGTGRGAVPWPEATPVLLAGPAALKNLQPEGSGFLDLRLPWLTLAHGGPEPGYLTRLGPVTPAQARYLARLAARDPGAGWRVVVTDDTGLATAVARARIRRSPGGPARASPASQGSLLRRVTVIVSPADLSTTVRDSPGTDSDLASACAAIITTARHAAAQAAARAAADTAAPGGCAHTQASLAYQVPARLREFVHARDLTCRFPTCRQPAWRCDADHTRPYDQDGRTCSCNLGPLCRYHHQLKQHPRWQLDQTAPGIFTWTTPTGRTYTIQPDQQAA
jgi:hypothetical protein